VLLTGANGQLGNDLLRVFQAAGDDVLPFTHTQLDVCSEERVSEVITQAKPDVVLNTAAFHKVEECEKKPALAFLSAHDAAYIVLAEKLGAALVTRDRRLASASGHAAAIELF
jgi:dTDP-4-dehydrorhamnose reductase